MKTKLLSPPRHLPLLQIREHKGLFSLSNTNRRGRLASGKGGLNHWTTLFPWLKRFLLTQVVLCGGSVKGPMLELLLYAFSTGC